MFALPPKKTLVEQGLTSSMQTLKTIYNVQWALLSEKLSDKAGHFFSFLLLTVLWHFPRMEDFAGAKKKRNDFFHFLNTFSSSQNIL